MLQLAPSTVFITSLLLYWLYYRMHYGKKPELYWKNGSKWSIFLNKRVATLKSVYWSFYLVPGGKLQTIVAAILPNKNKVSFEREIIDTPDGGQFTLAWSNARDIKETNKPIVFIYPGLVSTSESRYVITLTKAVVEKGYAAVVLVNRGLESPCLTGKAFCATHTADIEQALPIVAGRYPDSPIVAMGISLGGLVLTRYLAHSGSNSKVKAAFVYCCPFNPVLGSQSIEKWDNWLLYNRVLTGDLKKVYMRSRNSFSHIVDHDHLMNAKSIREVDERFTAKTFGYESVDHYYEDSVITKEMFDSIRTPTLCLCANDDAFVPEKALPRDDISQTGFVALAVTCGGGHVGHLSGLNPFSTPYYIDMFVDFSSAVFNHLEELPSS